MLRRASQRRGSSTFKPSASRRTGSHAAPVTNETSLAQRGELVALEAFPEVALSAADLFG
jgi:hypothetical protein